MMKTLLTAAVLAMASFGSIGQTGNQTADKAAGKVGGGGGMPLIIGHRGASFDAPENTLAAFKLGYEQKADGVEGDFWLTKDGKIACTHDESFKRCGAVDKKVSEMTLDEAEAVSVGGFGKFAGGKYVSETPPRLKDIFAAVPAGKLYFFEIKSGPEIVPVLKKELAELKFPTEQLRIISFKEPVVKACREQMPEVKAYWLTDFKKDKQTKKPTIGLKEVLATLKETKATGLDVNANLEMVNEAFVKALRAEGYEFHAWTVDDPAVAKRLVELGVDSITTNKPALIRAELSK